MNIIELLSTHLRPLALATPLTDWLRKNAGLYDQQLESTLKQSLTSLQISQNLKQIQKFNFHLLFKIDAIIPYNKERIAGYINQFLNKLITLDKDWAIEWAGCLLVEASEFESEMQELFSTPIRRVRNKQMIRIAKPQLSSPPLPSPTSDSRFRTLSTELLIHEMMDNFLEFAPVFMSVFSLPDFKLIVNSDSFKKNLGDYSSQELEAFAFLSILEREKLDVILKNLTNDSLVVQEQLHFYDKIKEKTSPIACTFSKHGNYIYFIGQDMSHVEDALRQQANTLATALSHDVGNKLAGVIPNIVITQENLKRIQQLQLDAVAKIPDAYHRGEFMSVQQPKFNAAIEEMTLALAESQLCSVNALSVLRDLLQSQELEAHQQKQVEDEFNLHKEIELIFNELVFTAKIRNIDYVFQNKVDLRTSVTLAKSFCTQTLSNLLNNAFKFVEDGDFNPHKKIELIVGLTEDKQFLTFTVKDNGRGIASSEIPFIFEKYKQAHEAIQLQYGGRGMGLTLVKNNVEKLKGQIFVESQGLHKGACFTVKIPFKPTAKKKKSLTSDEAEAFTVKENGPYRILIAEDNVINQKVIKRMLEKTLTKRLMHHPIERLKQEDFFVIHIVPDGKEAIESVMAAEQHGAQYDFIIMDNIMLTVHGVEATAKIKALNLENSPPIFFLTASTELNLKEKALSAGATYVFHKPMNDESLNMMLKSYVQYIFEKKSPSTITSEQNSDSEDVTQLVGALKLKKPIIFSQNLVITDEIDKKKVKVKIKKDKK